MKVVVIERSWEITLYTIIHLIGYPRINITYLSVAQALCACTGNTEIMLQKPHIFLLGVYFALFFLPQTSHHVIVQDSFKPNNHHPWELSCGHVRKDMQPCWACSADILIEGKVGGRQDPHPSIKSLCTTCCMQLCPKCKSTQVR